jgi:hypothetical protein
MLYYLKKEQLTRKNISREENIESFNPELHA